MNTSKSGQSLYKAPMVATQIICVGNQYRAIGTIMGFSWTTPLHDTSEAAKQEAEDKTFLEWMKAINAEADSILKQSFSKMEVNDVSGR